MQRKFNRFSKGGSQRHSGQKRGSSGQQGGFGGGGFQRDTRPREMHKVTCDECKNECEVPFKPIEGKPVFCKECYMKKKRY